MTTTSFVLPATLLLATVGAVIAHRQSLDSPFFGRLDMLLVAVLYGACTGLSGYGATITTFLLGFLSPLPYMTGKLCGIILKARSSADFPG